jgi:hypothetical protein
LANIILVAAQLEAIVAVNFTIITISTHKVPSGDKILNSEKIGIDQSESMHYGACLNVSV